MRFLGSNVRVLVKKSTASGDAFGNTSSNGRFFLNGRALKYSLLRLLLICHKKGGSSVRNLVMSGFVPVDLRHKILLK